MPSQACLRGSRAGRVFFSPLYSCFGFRLLRLLVALLCCAGAAAVLDGGGYAQGGGARLPAG
eukprot:125984-Alexandrium_andersonii.AAC.1